MFFSGGTLYVAVLQTLCSSVCKGAGVFYLVKSQVTSHCGLSVR